MKGQMRWFWWLVFLAPIIIFIYLGFTAEMVYRVPPHMQTTPITGVLKGVLSLLGLPDDWLYFPAIFYLFIVPFVGIFAIVFGFLREINIFRTATNLNWVIALMIAISIIPLGVFVRIVNVLFATMGIYSTFIFAALFFLGVIYVFIQRVTGWFPGQGPFAGLALEQRYTVLRDWLMAAARDNPGLPQVTRIPTILARAEKDWVAGRRTNAVRSLEHAIITVRNDIQRAGGSIPPGP